MKSKLIMAAATMVLIFYLIGCVSSNSAQVYSRDQAMKAQTLERGTVEAVKVVKIEGTKTPVGAGIGAISGGVLGSTIGNGSGSDIAAVVGALAGAAVGTLAEEQFTSSQGLEFIVKKDSGQTIVVVQEADDMIPVGTRVNIISANDGTVRVSAI